MKKNMVSHFYNFILLSLLVMVSSCQKQDVVSEIVADNGVIIISASGGLDFGSINTGVTLEKTLTLENIGGFPITNIIATTIGSSIFYSGSNYPGVGGTCSTTLAPKQTCTIKIEAFSETKDEAIRNLSFSYNDGIFLQTTSVTLIASIASVGTFNYGLGHFNNLSTLNDNLSIPVTYPLTSIGRDRTQMITIGNTGGRDISFTDSIFSNSDFSFTSGIFPGTNGNCQTTLSPKSVCQLEIIFVPTSEGVKNDGLTLNYHNGISADSNAISLMSEGIHSFANLIYAPTISVALGDVPQGLSIQKTLNISNTAVLEALTISGSLTKNLDGLIFTGGLFPGTTGTCLNTLASLNNCEVDLNFQSNTLGPHSEVLSINYNDNNLVNPLDKSIDLTFNANIVTAGNIVHDSSGDPTTFPIKAVGGVTIHTIILKNTGGYKAENFSVNLINNASGKLIVLSGSSCGVTKLKLIPNETCTLRVQATSAIIGTYTADIEVKFDDGLGNGSPNQTILTSLSASFVDTSNLAYIGGNILDFSEVLNGLTSSIKTITLYNSKQGAATSLVFDFSNITATDYQLISNNCGASLLGLSSCQLAFQVTPSITGIIFKTVGLNYQDALGTKSINLSLTTQSKVPANITLLTMDSTPAPFDLLDLPVGHSLKKLIILKNIGGFTATNINVTLPPGAFIISTEGSCISVTAKSLVGSGQCSFTVQFTPTSLGIFNDSIAINYYDGSATINKFFAITGLGALSGLFEKTAGASNIGSTIASSSINAIYTFTNNGDANVTSMIFDPLLSTDYSYGTNTCIGVLAPSATCEVEVIFTPAAASLSSDSIVYSYFTSLSTKTDTIDIDGIGIAPPELQISFTSPSQPSAYDFEETPLLTASYLSMTLLNTGGAVANNILLTLNQGAFTSFSIFDHNCPGDGTLNPAGACTILLRYIPESEAIHAGTFSITYDNYPNQPVPVSVSVTGEGVTPLAAFTGWSEIYAASDDTNGEFKIKWNAFQPTLGTITIDGYKVYQSIGTPLPTDLDSLVAFEVQSIVGDTDIVREYNMTGLTPDQAYYISIRPYYSTQVMNSIDAPSNITIYIPPLNMSLVHPYAVNKDICSQMNLTSVVAEQLGCAFTGAGNTGGYYKFNKYLFVDRYELSTDGLANPQNIAGKIPTEQINQFVADIACKTFSFGYQGQSIDKRLLSRSEWVAAAAWPDTYSYGLINSIEKHSTPNDCKLNQLTPSNTGSSSMCISQYGIYDMVGNYWEWNSDQVNGAIGWNSPIDGNSQMFGLLLGGIFPDEITNLPCFSYVYGVAQNITAELCPNGVVGSSISNILEDFYLPPLGTGIKSVRSGGGVGVDGGLTSRKGGRWVADLNSAFTSVTNLTAARCGFSLPF